MKGYATTAIGLTALVVLPVAGIAGFGLRLAEREHRLAVQHSEGLLRIQLEDQDRTLSALMTRRKQQVGRLLDGIRSDEDLHALWDHPLLDAAFALNSAGRATQPNPASGPLSRREEAFMERIGEVLEHGDLGVIHAEMPAEGRANDSGWVGWFWRDGLRLVYRVTDRRNQTLGVELNRARLLADVVAALPETSAAASDSTPRRICLFDERKQLIYQWGNYQPADGEAAAVTLQAGPPLNVWSWALYLPENARPGARASVQRFVVLVAAGCLALTALAGAWLVVRDVRRHLLEAATRVSFVNRVSHELRSPLTNICMYAELLEERLPDSDSACRRYSHTIARESRRLGRLIDNVLTFARQRRHGLQVHPRPCDADAVVRRVVEESMPALENAAMEVRLELSCSQPVTVDPDALEQIVFNLLSNALKYAAGEGLVTLSSRLSSGCYVLRVTDRGPGIPAALAERVFDPFYRGTDALNEGVSGTGIGLTIARQLAELHGGRLDLVEMSGGACFELSLPGGTRCGGTPQ